MPSTSRSRSPGKPKRGSTTGTVADHRQSGVGERRERNRNDRERDHHERHRPTGQKHFAEDQDRDGSEAHERGRGAQLSELRRQNRQSCKETITTARYAEE